MARLAAFIVAALAACASAFAPAAAPQTLRAAPLDAKLSLPKLSAPSFSAPVSKGPIRGPNPNKGGSRVVGKAGYTIGDKVDAAFCFVPLAEYDNSKPRVEFWERVAERRAAVAAQKGPKKAAAKKGGKK